MHQEVIFWIVGPQLIGVIFILMGFIQQKYPPKKINNLYGYRTAASIKSQQTWDEANRFATVYALKMGYALLFAGFCISACNYFIPTPDKIHVLIMVLAVLVAGISSGIAILLGTEKHLSKTFGDK